MANLVDNIFDGDEDTLKGRFLIFMIENELFGIEIQYVMEIIGIQAITEMPEMPEYLKGIINLRGRIIPVMDVRLRFSKASREYDDRTCVIVIDFNGISVGFIVDRVSEVITISDDNICDRPAIKTGNGRGYVKNIGKVDYGVILLVDCGKLLNDEEMDIVNLQLA